MFKQFLENATGVDIYLIISMSIFIFFFLGVGIWLITADKKQIEKMRNMPNE